MSDVRYLGTDQIAIETRASEAIRRARAASRDGTVHILALSGGGAGGAFGAGALIGLSRRGERPQYEIVTGVSTGALIAPFAFLGSGWDAQLTDAFTGDHSAGLLRSRGIGALFRPGLYRAAPLIGLVDRFVTPDLIDAVAREAAAGRMLLVATTDLDKEEAVIWDMGTIAARGGEAARRLFRDVLVASASIPGLFPPVMIHVEDGSGKVYDEMHVDGSTTLSLFVAPEAAFFARFDPAGLKNAWIYVLINGQMAVAPSTTRLKTRQILSRSFSAALKSRSRTQVVATVQFAQRYDMIVRVTGVPTDYGNVGSLDFGSSKMRTLFAYGAACAQDGLLWNTPDQAIGRRSAAVHAPSGQSSSRSRGSQCPRGDLPLPPESPAGE